MKKLLKVLTAICCIAVLFTTFATGVSAAEKIGLKTKRTDVPTQYGYTWATLGEVVKTEQNANYFVISTKAGDYTEELHVSFPQEGGFRLQSKHEYQAKLEVSNVGLFEPKSIATIDYKQDASGAIIMTGTDGTVLRFLKQAKGFELQVCNQKGKKLVTIGNDQISFAYKGNSGKIVRTLVELPITNDKKEVIYQGGARYNGTNQIGAYTALHNADCWSDDQYSYNNVPIFHSNRGYSIWFNMTYPGEADMGANNNKKYSLHFDGDKLDFFMWSGTPLENIKKYTSLTGTSGMYNEWVFGFWSGAMTAAFDATKEGDAFENLKVLMEGYYDRYGFYPEAMYGDDGSNSTDSRNLLYQKQRGTKILYGFSPLYGKVDTAAVLLGVQDSPSFDEEGKMISTGMPYIYSTALLNKGEYKIISDDSYEFSNPMAKDLIEVRMKQIWGWGIQGQLSDFGEHLSYNGTAFNGLTGMEMHNLNSYYYAKRAHDAYQEYHKGDYVLFQRSGAAGVQQYSGNHLGYQESNFDGMMDQVYSMISMGASGFNLYGGDWCGLSGIASNDLMSRWLTLSTFSPFMRQNGANIHTPWEQGEANGQNFGKYYYLRKNLVPTIMSAAMDANQTSNPIIKGMMTAYPYQLKLSQVSNQYLFCDDFLVCAVESENQYNLSVSLPNGSTWYSLFTYDAYKGGQTLHVEAPTAFMPVFVKGGAVKAIDLPESQILGDDMQDADDTGFVDAELPHDSLLVTPPDAETTSTIYTLEGNVTSFQEYDYTTEVYTNKPVSNATFNITIDDEEGSRRTTVLALGVTATAVSYDGNILNRLDHIPDYFQEEYGYYVDLTGLTTIYVPEGWKELSIVKGNADYKSLKLSASKDAGSMFDGNVRSAYQIPQAGTPTVVKLDYNAPQAIGRIEVKWAVGFASTYDIEYTADGSTWTKIIAEKDAKNTVTTGGGSIDIINFDEVKASAVRLNMVQAGDAATAPSIYSFEVFAPYSMAAIPTDETNLPEYEPDNEDTFEEEFEEEEWEEEWEEVEEEEEEEDEDEDDDEKTSTSTGKKKEKKKKVVNVGLPTWAIALIIGGGVVVVTGIVLLIILLLKKKKKAAAAAALEAAEDSPTDFPSAE